MKILLSSSHCWKIEINKLIAIEININSHTNYYESVLCGFLFYFIKLKIREQYDVEIKAEIIQNN